MTNSEIYEMILNQKNPVKLVSAWTLKDICINILASMFSYKGLPDSMPEEYAERFFIINGSVAGWRLDDPNAVRYKDEVIASIGCVADQPDAYGIGKKYIASTFSGYVKELDDSNGCIGWNNSNHTSDMPLISLFVDMLTEMFTSLKTNVIYSRLKPVFKASNDTEKRAIEEAFKTIKDDLAPIVVTSTNVLEEIDNNSESIKTLDITDVKNADKLQYIVKAADDLIRWFFTYYAGQAIQGNSKLAQQTKDEVQGTTSTSFILPNDRLYQRRKWAEKLNKMFNLNIEVDFSDAWKTESLKYKKEADLDENGSIEELAEKVDLETDPETEKETVEETEAETEKETEEEKEEKDE